MKRVYGILKLTVAVDASFDDQISLKTAENLLDLVEEQIRFMENSFTVSVKEKIQRQFGTEIANAVTIR